MRDRPTLGVNLPWLFGSYGHDLAPSERHPDWGSAFDPTRAETPLREARALGFDAVRVWLCENAEGIVTERGHVAGVHPALFESVARIQELAARHELALYWSLLDANSWKREGDELTRRIVEDEAETARFAELVAAPLARALDPAQTFAIEVLNEPEVMTHECAATKEEPTISWETIGRAVRAIGDAVRAEHRGAIVTAGTMHVFLPRLWAADAALDAIDIHMYHAEGGLPPPDHLARYVGEPRIASGEIALIAGECGLPEDGQPVEPRAIANYLVNAIDHGYAAAFLWRLERALITQDDRRARTDAGEAVAHALRRAPREAPLRPVRR